VFASLPNSRRVAIIASLAERHKIAAVAGEFGVTQAAISAGLKELEDRLGVTLFTRSAKGVIPTDAGELLAFHFRRSLAELRNIGADLAAMEGAVHGTLKIGALRRAPLLTIVCRPSRYFFSGVAAAVAAGAGAAAAGGTNGPGSWQAVGSILTSTPLAFCCLA
jgi:DNA-binding transcriptional ArsR family regulator